MVSTVRKSQASMLAACTRKKARHVERVRRGAVWRPASSRTLRTEVAETAMPRTLSSPTIRLYPQCGFSAARRRISSRSVRSSGGRPGLRREYPPAFDQLAVPAKQRLRLEREGRPRRPRQRAAQRRQQRSISPGQLRPDSLPTEDRQLVAEDEDLQLLRATRPSQQPHQREQVSHNEINKRPEQTALPRPWQSAEPSDLDAPGERRTSSRT